MTTELIVAFCLDGIELLNFESPFFDVLWPTIFEVADYRTQNTLHLTSRYFQNMWKATDIRRRSEVAVEQYGRILAAHPCPSSCRLLIENETSSRAPYYYSWEVKYPQFPTLKSFRAFCVLADVDVNSRHEVSVNGRMTTWAFASRSREVIVTMTDLPGITYPPYMPPIGGLPIRELRGVGGRERAKMLEDWVTQNCVLCDPE